MCSKPSLNRINVLQNIEVKSAKTSRKKRVTSSMIFFDEEPVFSNSEDELEYTRLNFSIPPPPPVINKYCDAEVQCELMNNHNSITALIHQCANINPENVSDDIREIVEICQKFTFRLNRQDALCDVTNGSKFTNEKIQTDIPKIGSNLEKPLPSRRGSSCNVVQHEENDLTLSIPFEEDSSDEEKRINKDERRKPKRRKKGCRLTEKRKKRSQKMNYINGDVNKQNGSSIINLGSKSFEKREKFDSSKNIDSVATEICNFKEFSFIAPRNPNSGNTSFFNSLHSTSLKKKPNKSLARNWMKQNCSLKLEEIDRPKQNFISLQDNRRKVRKLYSPTRYLQSQEFLKSREEYLAEP